MITTKKVSGLVNWDKNPRFIKDKRYEELKTSIKELGFNDVLKLAADGKTVIGGNMRLNALKELGIEEVDVKITKAKTPQEILKVALRDNESFGEYDREQLVELAFKLEIPDIELQTYQVHLNQSQSLGDIVVQDIQEVIEDEAPPIADVAISKLGEIYQLGRHRLMAGDSTDFGQVSNLMDGEEADMVFTDPPYGVDYEGKTKEKLRLNNDSDTETFALAIENFITKPGAAFYVCCPPGNNFKDFLLAFETKCRQSATIIWVKNSMVLGHGDYHYQHEPILYGWNKEGNHKFYGSRDQTTVWNIPRPSISREHPTMKPLALVSRAIRNSSKKGDIVLDLFGGSGSTLIACEQLDRTNFSMEIDLHYIDVIIKRWMKFTDKRAYRIRDADGKQVNEPVQFADESFMGSKK